MRHAWIILSLVCLGLCLACTPAFSPGEPDGDLDGDIDPDGDLDGDLDGDEDPDADGDADDDPDEDPDPVVYNLRLSPDFLRVGGKAEGGTISFKNLEEVREALGDNPSGFPTWQIDYGKDITFLVVRFDPEELRFYDIEMAASLTARTGARTVSARISYGDVTVIEYGEFYVLPALEGGNALPRP